MICSLLTILQCLHSESCTVWSSPSSIDCCHLHRVAGEWSQSSQHMLSAPLSCSVHNVSGHPQQHWSIELQWQHISHTAHTEGPPSQHCCWIQCQSIHYHRTRRSCFKHCYLLQILQWVCSYFWYVSMLVSLYSAPISIVSGHPQQWSMLNTWHSTAAVNVYLDSSPSVSGQDHYRCTVHVFWTTSVSGSVHYSRGSGRRRRQVLSETVTFPMSTSSGVVSGLQEGQQYQFSVTVSLLIDGKIFNSTPGTPLAAMTGNMSGCSVCWQLS